MGDQAQGTDSRGLFLGKDLRDKFDKVGGVRVVSVVTTDDNVWGRGSKNGIGLRELVVDEDKLDSRGRCWRWRPGD